LRTAAIVAAAGRGQRAELGFNKIFAPLLGEPVIAHALRALERCDEVGAVVVVTQEGDIAALREVVERGAFGKVCDIVAGGPRRQDSIALGLAALSPDTQIVIIHDAARPLVSPELLSESVRVCEAYGSAVAAVPVSDTVKRAGASRDVVKTLEREGLWAVQTPQTFRYELIKRAYDLGAAGPTVSDDAYLVELLGERVHLIEGSRHNLKITVPDDLALAEALLAVRNVSLRSMSAGPTVGGGTL
jgi:2-C-methyl-D-erythritol 4-phosphate cytidylyltransferase